MGRIRTVKPEFFKNLKLFELEEETGLPLRVAFSALWTVADREGRFVWIPRQLKIDCLPYDEVDFSRVLDALSTRDFVRKYSVGGREYGYIPAFSEHQVINNRESASKLPDPSSDEGLTRESRVNDATVTTAKGKGKEGKGKERKEKELVAVPAPVAEVSAPDSGYPFEGENFRINQKDFDKHRELFPALDLFKEYQQIDLEIRELPKKQRWSVVNAKLNYRNKNQSARGGYQNGSSVSNVQRQLNDIQAEREQIQGELSGATFDHA